MQSLIRFLVKYNSVLLFIVLQVICFALIVRHNREQRAIFGATTTYFSGTIYNAQDFVNNLYTMERENRKLVEDNARLFERLEDSKFNNIIESDTTSNQEYLQQYTYTAAKVINNSINRANNYLTIDRGKRHGIEKHSAVIGTNGIVGIVVGVSEQYAVVMSLFHQQTKLSASVKSKGFFGSLVWNGSNSTHINLEAIPRHAKIERGDTIITSGYSSIFPGGVMVGLVDKVKPVEGSSFHQIDVLLSEDLNRINYVYVIKNLFQEEQRTLEEEVDYE